MSTNNYTITTPMVFGGNVLANMENVLAQNPQLSTVTYQDANPQYMHKDTRCQVALPSKLIINLANMPDFSTSTTNEKKAKYVLTEIASWSPGIMTINGIKIHFTTHDEYIRALHYFMNSETTQTQTQAQA
jgi:hypothetical protein